VKKISKTIDIQASPQRVFDFLTLLANTKATLEHPTEVRKPDGVGAVART
jgi:hypothetical protein